LSAPRSPLRAVKAGESPATPKHPMTVTEAVESGSLRDQYVAMRARIARAIDAPVIRGADLAALSRRMHELGREIAVLDAKGAEEGDGDSATPDEHWEAV